MKLESIEYSLVDDSYVLTIKLYRDELDGAPEVKPRDNDLARFAMASMEKSIQAIAKHVGGE